MRTHLIDKEIDRIYQMKGEIVGHAGGCSSDVAGFAARGKVISFSDCALYVGIWRAGVGRICNPQTALEIHGTLFGWGPAETPQKGNPGKPRADIGTIYCWMASPCLTSLLTTTSTITMVSFPPELLGAIVSEVHSLPDLLRLRETNHTLNEFATPHAFRSVVLANRDKSIQNFRLLSTSRLAPFVREVVFQYMELDPSMFVPSTHPSIHPSIHPSRLILVTDYGRRQEK
jgi:hypothetical protein